ncbi:MAG: hypothetical protein MUF07_13565 [Steroidobacteraceae bacterium]|jgi:hypothetical protein|nr:hypothetical protein [Steroidobacteraceae bacterium]
MSSTGRFRTDIIAAAGIPRDPQVPPSVTPPAVPGATPPASGTPYANWADRMQRTRGRHAAITRNLYTWSSYKNWTEKVKDSWQDEPAEKDAGKKPTR